MKNLRNSLITAVMVALCVVLPMGFHAVGAAGKVFSPMHIPVLLCGLISGPVYGLVCGILGPFLSSLMTGMPPMAYLPPMLFELAAYGLVAGLMYKLVKLHNWYARVYVALGTSMLAGRIVAAIVKALFFARGNFTFAAWISGYFVTCWPAIVIQLIAIPLIMLALQKAHLIED